MKNSGFTLLELILAITIAAMMSIVLFTSFYQTNRTVNDVNAMISIDARATIFQNQFEKDISGVFIPNIEEVKEEKLAVPISKEKAEAEKKAGEKKAEEQKQQGPKKLEKAFYSINQNKMLKELSIITCNPLQIYGESKPRIARVSYKLKENKNIKNSFTLFRQESLQLKYGEDKKAIEYEVIDNIKELTITYLVPSKGENEKGSVQFKKFGEWKFNEEQEKELGFKLPLFVNVKLVLWDTDRQSKEQTFEFKYIIYAFTMSKQKQAPAKTQEADKKEKEAKQKNEKEKTANEKLMIEQKITVKR